MRYATVLDVKKTIRQVKIKQIIRTAPTLHKPEQQNGDEMLSSGRKRKHAHPGRSYNKKDQIWTVTTCAKEAGNRFVNTSNTCTRNHKVIVPIATDSQAQECKFVLQFIGKKNIYISI